MKKMTALFFLLLLSGCIPYPPPNGTTNESSAPWYEVINSNISCEPILDINYGYEEYNFLPLASGYPQVSPQFISFDQEGNIYLDDQGNDRILKFSDLNQPPRIINIPLHRDLGGMEATQLYWLGMVISGDRIFILHNPSASIDRHMLLSVHELDGTEIAVIDISTLPQLTDSDRDFMADNWGLFFSLNPDGHGGVYFHFPLDGFILVNRDLEVTTLNPNEMGFSSGGNLVSGWNRILYSYQSNSTRFVMIHYGTWQNIDWVEFNDRIEQLGFTNTTIRCCLESQERASDFSR